MSETLRLLALCSAGGSRGGDGGGPAVDIGVVGLDRKGGGLAVVGRRRSQGGAIQGQDQGPGGGRIVYGRGDGGGARTLVDGDIGSRSRLMTGGRGSWWTMTSAVSKR